VKRMGNSKWWRSLYQLVFIDIIIILWIKSVKYKLLFLHMYSLSKSILLSFYWLLWFACLSFINIFLSIKEKGFLELPWQYFFCVISRFKNYITLIMYLILKNITFFFFITNEYMCCFYNELS
jgi:hypothetical protein